MLLLLQCVQTSWVDHVRGRTSLLSGALNLLVTLRWTLRSLSAVIMCMLRYSYEIKLDHIKCDILSTQGLLNAMAVIARVRVRASMV